MGGASAKQPTSPDRSLGPPTTTQLVSAVEKGNVEAIRACVAQGADPCAYLPLSMAITPLHLACSRAAHRADNAYLEALLAAKPIDLNVADAAGWTPLHSMLHGAAMVAPRKKAIENVLAALRIIVAKGADVNARSRVRGETPLHLAARVGKPVVEELIRLGAALNVSNLGGSNALAYAAVDRQFEVVSALLHAGESPNTLALNSEPLLLWSSTSEPAVFHMLVDAGAATSCVMQPDSIGRTLLFQRLEESVMRRLVALGADVNARDRDAHTALHVHYFRLEHVRLLVAAGADVNAQDRGGSTSLHYLTSVPSAAPQVWLPIVEELLAGGADGRIRDKGGCTAMDLVPNGCRWMRERLECTKLP